MRTAPSLLLALLLAFLVLTSCGGRPAPFVDPARVDIEKRVLVFVPGITGSVLRDPLSGKVAWGVGRNLVGPKDGGHRLALPIGTATAITPGVHLEADGILESIRLLGLKKQIYRPLIDLFTANGYTLGDLESPREDEDLFLFAYDWRQDNIASAQRLAAALEELRLKRGVERLAIDLVCQSNGGTVCRWLSRFGGADLETVEAGQARPPAGLDVHQVVLVGTANGGSLRTLREMTRGRRYVPWFGRRFEPETFFTLTALFQDLPSYRKDIFVDLEGRDLDIDIFDPAVWETYGWAIFSPRARRSLRRRPNPPLFGDLPARRAHLGRMLDRSARLHAVLAADAPLAETTRFHLIQNTAWPTPDRGILERQVAGDWQLLVTGDKQLRPLPALQAAVTAMGDGHASVASQGHLAPSERTVLVGETFAVDAGHFETILQPEAHRRVIEILVTP